MSKKQKLTPWFPADVKPVRVGRYQLRDHEDIWLGWWDGCAWWYRDRVFRLSNQNRSWRGLAKEPK